MQRHALAYLTSPSFLSLAFPPPSYCSLISASITCPFVNRTSLHFTKEPSIQLPPTPGVPPAMLPLSVLFAPISDYFFSIKTLFFFPLSHFPWNLPHVFINTEKE